MAERNDETSSGGIKSLDGQGLYDYVYGGPCFVEFLGQDR
jgi:hypothetical protein